MIDTHTHLNFQVFTEDWRDVVERAVANGVEKMIVVGTDLASNRRAVEMAESHPALFAAVGIHPHHIRDITIINIIKAIEELAKRPKVVAIGEVGLDYHVYQGSKKYSGEQLHITPKLKIIQKQLLGAHVEIAKRLHKPLILHSREAGEDVLDVLAHFSKVDGVFPAGVFHCFDGSKKYVEKILAAGLYISFTGNITFVQDRAQVAQLVPLDRLLLETDCPYMLPRLVREREERKCEPRDVVAIAQFHAEQRGVPLSAVADCTTANARRLFTI